MRIWAPMNISTPHMHDEKPSTALRGCSFRLSWACSSISFLDYMRRGKTVNYGRRNP